MEYKKNDIIKNFIATELTYEGYGTNRDYDKLILVENLLENEEADIQIIKATSKVVYAKVCKLIKKSKLRKETEYPELLASGAALLSNMDYENQVAFKQDIVNKLFLRNLPNLKVLDIIKSKKEFWYRNKIKLNVIKKRNKFIYGFFEKKSHNLVEQEHLYLAHKEIDNLFLKIKKLFAKHEASIALDNFEMTLKHSKFTKELQLIIEHSNDYVFPENTILELEQIKNLVSFIQITEKETRILFGAKDLVFKTKNNIYKVAYDAFYQINDEQTEKLYDQVLKRIKNKDLTILDAYAGVGTIGLHAAKKAKKLISVEINKNASIATEINANLNAYNNIEFINEDSEICFKKMLSENKHIIDLIIFDPPREGMNKSIIDIVSKLKIKQIIYVSCNPHTMIRDLKDFEEKGYEIGDIQPIDMFPQTPHIETICSLKLK
ncbi:23S rRNA (uracil(1939)-C(5))-methyltransferase RlmD [Mycoplasma struthionis]|uniref:23S rRNA (Uracil(1939)-C(5))-methyltransferase RlmD n=1 Tax=Mycoplasma struthionis TaxID=538220 RepID=A0A502M2D3_9MOLU|nr:23S rRNA (uracil(1939)-C(5))-methyltransferase RlmD [Mycoplasma struthionis]TPI02484.1 23S rRNA (uracil(1939)-C(5))-methyltransferase RlmD [Mycoplasma struthionis]